MAPPSQPNNTGWSSEFHEQVFSALAASERLAATLIFKGARVLRYLLPDFTRVSYDIDASFAASIQPNSAGQAQLEEIRLAALDAIRQSCESQSPVRYVVRSATLRNRRSAGPHPRGWDVYWLTLQVQDLVQDASPNDGSNYRIDIAAPEKTTSRSFTTIAVGSSLIRASSLERIAGEKLRAFLTSLPAYRRKIGETSRVDRRVKDLYDLVRVARVKPTTDEGFWAVAGGEFCLACESRCVDCAGLPTFFEGWEETRVAFQADKSLPPDVPFHDVERTLQQIIGFFDSSRITPLQFPLLSLDA